MKTRFWTASILAYALAGSGLAAAQEYDPTRVDDHRTPLVELRRLLNLWRSGQVLSDANQQLQEGNVTAALASAQKAVEMAPGSDNAWVALAHMRLRAGQQAGAFEALQRAVTLNPTARQRLQRSQNFQSVRDTPEFRKLVGSK